MVHRQKEICQNLRRPGNGGIMKTIEKIDKFISEKTEDVAEITALKILHSKLKQAHDSADFIYKKKSDKSNKRNYDLIKDRITDAMQEILIIMGWQRK